MKTAEDFKRAIGPADAAFEARVRQTLVRLQAEEKKAAKRKIGPVLAIALVLLLASAAYAAAVESGWLSYLRAGSRALLPETEQLVAQAYTLPAPIDTPLMTVEAVQAVHDGNSLQLYVRMAPKENLLIVNDSCIAEYMAGPHDAYTPADIMNQPLAEMGHDFWGEKFEGMTLMDYLLREGKGLLLVNIWAYAENQSVAGYSFQTNADGSYEAMMTMQPSTEADVLTARIDYRYLYITAERVALKNKLQKTPWYTDSYYGDIPFSVPANQPLRHGRLAKPVYFAEHGATLEGADVVLTPFQMRLDLTWSYDSGWPLADTVASQIQGGICIDGLRICGNDAFKQGKDCRYIVRMTVNKETRTITMAVALDPQATLPASVWIDWEGERKAVPLSEAGQ